MEIDNKFSRGEELANAISHLVGAILAITALILMIRHPSAGEGGLRMASITIFGCSMVILYISSTLTHILPMGKVKDLFFNVDRIAIYALIAGTYTPIALITLNGLLGWIIFGVEWGFALVGSIVVLARPGDYDTGVNKFYVISYAVMGWLILVALVPLFNILPLMGTLWIIIGGITYSVGIIFFNTVRFPYHHLVWHLLVIGGTLCHFFAVYNYIIPN